ARGPRAAPDRLRAGGRAGARGRPGVARHAAGPARQAREAAGTDPPRARLRPPGRPRTAEAGPGRPAGAAAAVSQGMARPRGLQARMRALSTPTGRRPGWWYDPTLGRIDSWCPTSAALPSTSTARS